MRETVRNRGIDMRGRGNPENALHAKTVTEALDVSASPVANGGNGDPFVIGMGRPALRTPILGVSETVDRIARLMPREARDR